MKTYKDLRDSMTPEQIAEADRLYQEVRNSVPECLRNLVWASGKMYYVDDNGVRIDKPIDKKAVSQAMVKQMKDTAPETPLKINGVEVDREEILKKALG